MAAGNKVSRRQFLRILAGAGAGALIVKGGWESLAPGRPVARQSRLMMGTVVDLTVVAGDGAAAQAAARACLARMSSLEAVLSRFDPRSEVSRLNATGRLEKAGAPLLTLLEQSHAVSERSGGAFDITVKPLVDLYQRDAAKGLLPSPRAVGDAMRLVDYRRIACSGSSVALTRPGMQITLDAIAKGFIVDAGVAVLREHGITDVLLEAGGDLVAAGQRAPGTPWRVGVESPRPAHPGFMTTCRLSDRAMATSGDYMQSYTADHREYHIVDPRVGRSPRQLASATVTAPSAMLADALATTCMVAGARDGLRLVEALTGCEAYLVTKRLRTVKSSGFRC